MIMIDHDKVIMPKMLTAENGAKYVFIGEFFETVNYSCHYEVCTPGDCPVCGGSGTVKFNVPVSWYTIKEIYKKAVDHFGEVVP